MRQTTFLFYFLLCLFILPDCSLAQKSSQKTLKQDMDAFYTTTFQDFGSVASAAVAVVKDGKTVYQNAFGTANFEKDLKASPNTNYYIASSTKSFTALLAALLDDEGVIKFNDPLTKYFPNIQFDPALNAHQIKIEDLITHTSGLSNDPISYRSAYSGDHDLEALIGLLKFSEPNKAGQGNFQYTNVGYNIYTLIVEKVTGKTWQQLLQEKIFTPLKMDRTTAYISRAEQENWDLAKPYFGWNAEEIEEVYLMKKDNTMQSAGGLITTASDLTQWLKVQLALGKLNGKQIFKQSIMEKSQRVLAKASENRGEFKGEGYGLGWNIGKYGTDKVVWHFGGFPGFFTHVSFLPEQNVGVIVMVNDGAVGYPLMSLFAHYAYEKVLEKEGTDEKYKEEGAALKEKLKERSKKMKQHIADRAKRSWQLSKNFEAYTGTFVNEQYGSVEIDLVEEKLNVSMGNMYCIAEPYTKENTIRVELVPFSGELIQFSVENDTVNGFKYGDLFFEKIK